MLNTELNLLEFQQNKFCADAVGQQGFVLLNEPRVGPCVSLSNRAVIRSVLAVPFKLTLLSEVCFSVPQQKRYHKLNLFYDLVEEKTGNRLVCRQFLCLRCPSFLPKEIAGCAAY